MSGTTAAYLSVSTPVDGNKPKFDVVNLEGEEGVSRLFEYQLTLLSTDSGVLANQLLGKAVTVTLEDYSGNSHFRSGLITRFIQANSDTQHTNYHIVLSPWLWLLTQSQQCRIFQQQTVTDIISAVFNQYSDANFSDKTSGSYPELDFCVQYRESDFTFVSRLMEEYGIYYYFEHSDGKHTLILSSDSTKAANCPNLSEAKVAQNNLKNDNLVTHCTLQQQITSNGFTANDYNFQSPDVDLTCESEGEGDTPLHVYRYPGRYQQAEQGSALTDIRLQAQQAAATMLSGDSHCRGFVSGYTFSLKNHTNSTINGAYFISYLRIKADQTQYQNQFQALPKTIGFCPPESSPKPRIYGSQTALVVGKSGEEIWTDQYGRIKIQFYWDQQGQKDENSSCWIRVAQMWAGKGWGSQFIPRINTEVVVSFLDGDPDRPIVTGTVYNGNQTLPYNLPDKQTTSALMSRSSKAGTAGNELRFDDTKDAEELYLHAQKDMTVLIENARSETLNQGDDTLTISKGNRSETISEGNDSLTISKGDRRIDISTGNETHSVKGTRGLTVEGDETRTNKAKFTHSVTGDYSLSVDGDLSISVKGNISINGQGISLAAKQDVSISADQNISCEAQMSLNNKAGTSLNNKASASMTLDGGGELSCKGGVIKLN